MASTEQEVVVTDVPQTEKKTNEAEAEKEETTAPPPPPPHPQPDPAAEKPLNPIEKKTLGSEISKKAWGDIYDDKAADSNSFKEESTKVADLTENEKKALDELKQLISDALNKHEFSKLLAPPKEEQAEALGAEKEEEKKESVEEKDTGAVTAAEHDEPTKTAPKTEQGRANETETVVVTEVVEEKVSADYVDDDGAKTVEAIEESVVAVSSSEKQGEEVGVNPPEAEHKEGKDKDEALPLPPATTAPEELSIWGIPLLSDERSDVILLKFLRARDFKVKEAFTMIKNTICWREEFGIEELMEQDLGNDLEKVVFMSGFDKEGHPVCYNVYGEFQDKELYHKTFSDEEKRHRFLRWRIQFLEKSIRTLDFKPGGICTIVQVNDLKNSPGLGKKELRQATNQALQLLQDNYPEFVAKQIFINVPWWYLAVNRMISPFLTQRTKSKFVFAGPSKSAETLLRYIAAEQIPVKYGGLSKDGEFGIGNTDSVTEITVRPAAEQTIEFTVTESCLLSWEVRVLGWDVTYGAEFVPSSEDSYTVIIQKARKVGSSEEPVLHYSYKVGEPGKVVLTVENPSSKKKKLLYRLKAMPSSD